MKNESAPRRRNGIGILFLSAALFVIVPLLHASSQGYSPDAGKLVWKFFAANGFYSSPFVSADGKVYAGAKDKSFYCIDARTGKKLWSYETGGMISSSAVVADGKVYFGSMDAVIYCLDAATGAEVWQFPMRGLTVSSPAVARGKVYVGSSDHYLYCLDAKTGALVWKYETKGIVNSSPAVAEGRVVFTSLDRNIYCLSADTGAGVWVYTTGAQSASSPCVADGKVYAGSSDGNVYCLGAASGSLYWKTQTGNPVNSSPCVADGNVYAGSGSTMYCMNASDGAVVWSSTDTSVYSSPCYADGRIYYGGLKIFYCLDASTGNPVWTYPAGSAVNSSPCVANGLVYVGGLDGNLYCFDSGKSGLNASAYPSISGMDAFTRPEIIPPTVPARLTLTVSADTGADNLLRAGETGTLTLTVKNDGRGDGKNLTVAITPLSGMTGVTCVLPAAFEVPAGKTATVSVPVTAGLDVKTGYAEFEVSIREPFFSMDSAPVNVKLQTMELLKPELVLGDWGVDDDNMGASMGNGNHTIEEGEVVELEVVVMNRGVGDALGVTVTPQVAAVPGIAYIGRPQIELGDISAGQYRTVRLPVSVGRGLSVRKTSVGLKIDESRGIGGTSGSFEFQVGTARAVPQSVVVERGDLNVPSAGAAAVSPSSDVDVNFPAGVSPLFGTNTLAIVIGNRDYTRGIPNVDYALNDAVSFKQTLVRTLGIPASNVWSFDNMGLADMIDLFGASGNYKLSKLYRTIVTGRRDVIVYYSGHGAPSLNNHQGYLVPVDATVASIESTGYALGTLYDNLQKMKADGRIGRLWIVFDSCFSGGSGAGNLVQGVSPASIRLEVPALAMPDAVAFQSAGANQVSAWYPEKAHGLFTYFLLKGLQGDADANRDKEITVGELKRYLLDKVPAYALQLRAVEQTPQILAQSDGTVLVRLQ